MTDTAALFGAQAVEPRPSFDLTRQPWIPVQRRDGTEAELSLREVFAEAHELRRLAAEIPSQEFALLRLMLAVAHDALRGPADIDAWAEAWEADDCFAPVPAYLDEHRGRFDLLHPEVPFLQVAELRGTRDEILPLSRIVADVPGGEPYFSARMPTIERLTFAEAARWVVHVHAWDTSGIKTGAAGDVRAKGGKVYPLGTGWAGALGGVFAEGATLRETLLLNLLASDTTDLRFAPYDRPSWRRPKCGPGAWDNDEDNTSEEERPSGLRDLYTWQGRRVRLHFDANAVTGVVLGYGDPLSAHNRHGLEPMTAWRRSRAQEKKRGEDLVYLPLPHDPARSAWRGLAAMLADKPGSAQGSQAAERLAPRVLEWIARLATTGVLPRDYLITARTIGAVYGTQQSVVDEVFEDRVTMGVILLHREQPVYARQAIAAVADAEGAVRALGNLAAQLARAAGIGPESPRATASDLGFGELDGPYRLWLAGLATVDDPYVAREAWRGTVRETVARLGSHLLRNAGDAAWEGRLVKLDQGPGKGKREIWLNSALADRWFRRALGKSLAQPGDEAPGDGPSDDAPDLQ